MDKEIYSKYTLYKQYFTSDGVHYSPSGKYKAVKTSGNNDLCDCGYSYWGDWLENGEICGREIDQRIPLSNWKTYDEIFWEFNNDNEFVGKTTTLKYWSEYRPFYAFSGTTLPPSSYVEIVVLYNELEDMTNTNFFGFVITGCVGEYSYTTFRIRCTEFTREDKGSYVMYKYLLKTDDKVSTTNIHKLEFRPEDIYPEPKERLSHHYDVSVIVNIYSTYNPNNEYKKEIKYQYCDGNMIPIAGDSSHSPYQPQTQININNYVEDICPIEFNIIPTSTRGQEEIEVTLGETCYEWTNNDIYYYKVSKLQGTNFPVKIVTAKTEHRVEFELANATSTYPEIYILDVEYYITYFDNGTIKSEHRETVTRKKTVYGIKHLDNSFPNAAGGCCDICKSWGDYGGTYYGECFINGYYYWMFENPINYIPMFSTVYPASLGRRYYIGAFQPWGLGDGCSVQYNTTLYKLKEIEIPATVNGIANYAFANSSLEKVVIHSSEIKTSFPIFCSDPSNTGTGNFGEDPTNLKRIEIYTNFTPSVELIKGNKLPDNGVLVHRSGTDFSEWMEILRPKGWTEVKI